MPCEGARGKRKSCKYMMQPRLMKIPTLQEPSLIHDSSKRLNFCNYSFYRQAPSTSTEQRIANLHLFYTICTASVHPWTFSISIFITAQAKFTRRSSQEIIFKQDSKRARAQHEKSRFLFIRYMGRDQTDSKSHHTHEQETGKTVRLLLPNPLYS